MIYQYFQKVKNSFEKPQRSVKNTKVNLKINVKKCKFFTDNIKFLGYKLIENGMILDKEKIQSLQDMPYQKKKKELPAGEGRALRSLAQLNPSLAYPTVCATKKKVGHYKNIFWDLQEHFLRPSKEQKLKTNNAKTKIV